MFPTRKYAACPVCRAVLGTIVEGRATSFVCNECQWIWKWDREGDLQKPVKVGKSPEKCDCGSCQARDEEKLFGW